MPDFHPERPSEFAHFLFQGAWPTAVTFLESSRRLVVGNRDGELLLWELPEAPLKTDGKSPALLPPLRKLAGHANGVTRLAYSTATKRLLSASLDRTIRVWDPDAKPDGKADVVLKVASRRRGRRRPDQKEHKPPSVSVPTIAAEHVFAHHKDWVKGFGLSGDGRRFVSGDDAALVTVWNLPDRKRISQWTGYPGDGVTAAALSPDGKTAFVAEYRAPRGDFDRPPAQVRFWDAEKGTEKLDVLKVMFPKVKVRDNSYGYAQVWGKFVARGLVAAAFSPDGKLLAAGQGGETGTGKVHLIDTAAGKLVRSVSGHQNGVTDVTFSADGKYVLSTGRDTCVRVCRVSDGKQVAQLGKPRGGQFKDWYHAVAISPDQRFVAATDIAGSVRVWRFDA
jgi:WD40 repeat protein